MGEKIKTKTKGTIVYHLIHVRFPPDYIPKLVIIGDHFSKEEIERAGFLFEEFGIPWANHHILHFNSTDEIPSRLMARIKSGEGRVYTAEEFRELIEKLL